MSPICRILLVSKIATMYLLLICAGNLSATQNAQSADQRRLNQPVRDYADAGNLSLVVSRLLQKHGIKVGIELRSAGDDRPVQIYIAQGTVANVLDTISARAPGYRWSEVDGVVDVVPRQGGSEILNLKIASFRVSDANALQLQSKISSLPEITNWLKKNEIVARTASGDGTVEQPRVTLTLRNVTLRTILNVIVGSPEFTSWLVSRYGDHGQFMTIRIG
jgi:hypothetical protein